jgi:hypothetical protein
LLFEELLLFGKLLPFELLQFGVGVALGEDSRLNGGKFAVGLADQLLEVALAVTGPEFRGGMRDGAEQNVSDFAHGGGLTGADAAIGDASEEAGEGFGEGVRRDEVAADGLKDFEGGLLGFLGVTEFAIVVVAVFGVGGAGHGALAAMGGSEDTRRGAVLGGTFWHLGSS